MPGLQAARGRVCALASQPLSKLAQSLLALRMFFVLSKILGFFANPSNVVISMGVLGVLLLLTPWRRLGFWLATTSVVVLAVLGLSPIGNALLIPLEDRFPAWHGTDAAPAGMVVLGGAITPDVSLARDEVALNEAAERLTAAAALARRYPDARIIYSGGSGALIYDEGNEAPLALALFESLGIARERIALEDRSRNTIENAMFSKAIAQPKPAERWLLVTSAYHMPRAMGAFRKAGFQVEAYPVDWRTRGREDALRAFATLGDGLRRTDTAVHEWVGLFAYWLSGRSSELFPRP
jgi:uncharacterized SAM-binding protein YcdF (DUF218 family)